MEQATSDDFFRWGTLKPRFHSSGWFSIQKNKGMKYSGNDNTQLEVSLFFFFWRIVKYLFAKVVLPLKWVEFTIQRLRLKSMLVFKAKTISRTTACISKKFAESTPTYLRAPLLMLCNKKCYRCTKNVKGPSLARKDHFTNHLGRCYRHAKWKAKNISSRCNSEVLFDFSTHLWNCPVQSGHPYGSSWYWYAASSPGRPKMYLSLRGGGRRVSHWPCRARGLWQLPHCCPCGGSRKTRHTMSWSTIHSHSPRLTGGNSALLDVWQLLASCVCSDKKSKK